MVITALDITLLVWGKSLWGLAWPGLWHGNCSVPNPMSRLNQQFTSPTIPKELEGNISIFFFKECFLPTIPLDFSGTSECQKVCTYSLLFREQLIELPRFGSTAVYL
jgi:hypothetical protein